MKSNPRLASRALRALASLLLAAQLHALSSASAQDAPAASTQQETKAVGASRQPNSDGSMQGVDLEHTRVFRTRAPREPKELTKHSEKLFQLKKEHVSWDVEFFGLSLGFWYSSQGFHFTIPVVAGDAIYFTVAVGDGYLFALDKATGQMRWRLKAERDEFSPLAVAGGAVYVATADGTFCALDAATGRELWKWSDKSRGGFISPPAVHDGVVYFSVTNDQRRGGRWFAASKSEYEGRVLAIDARTGRDVWRFETKKRLSLMSPLVAGGTLYVGGDRLVALDPKTGRERWGAEPDGGVYTMAAAGGTIYFSDVDGRVSAVAAADGSPKWKADKKLKTRTMLAVANDAVYFGGKSRHVHALDAATGREKWVFKTALRCGAPSLAEGFVYFSCGGEFLHALDAATGQERWKFGQIKEVTASPVVADGVLYLLRADGFLYALR